MDKIPFAFCLSPESRDYTTRNILSLEERVAVIREFERRPVYQHIAEKFNCSSKQIKNIISNKQEVMACYNETRVKDDNFETWNRRRLKIEFLGKVIYEYVMRALYHQVPIDVHAVRAKTMEVKECIAVENFYPNDRWLKHFQQIYQIPIFDADTLQKRVVSKVAKKPSLKTIDIIHYVSQREKEVDSNGNGDAHIEHVVLPVQYSCYRVENNTNDPPMVVEVTESDVKTNKNNNNNNNNFKIKAIHSQQSVQQVTAIAAAQQEMPKVQNELPDVENCADALRHLKVLEEFALLNENYRAIGLIMQLQQVFEKPPRSEDFES